MSMTIENAEHRRRHLRGIIQSVAGGNLAAWARPAGVNESTVRSFLDGTTSSMTDRTYAKLSAHYGIPIAYLKGEPGGNADPVDWPIIGKVIGKVPVVGYVGAGAEIYYPEGDATPLDDVDVIGAGEGAEAVVIRGDSMTPSFRDSDVIVYQRATYPTRDLLGEECVVRVADGRTFIKILMPGKERGLFSLISHNPAMPPITDIAIEWAVPVVQRISGRWKFTK
jgi:SOS-response transcriptional repressor LexA